VAANPAAPVADQPAQPAANQPLAPSGPSPAEIRTARDRFANLDARADAVTSGVQTIRTQQKAQGLDLRGDILAALNRLNNDMSQSNVALSQNDLATADEYMDRADKELATLEKFLGR
jgi:serine/threonine-protein kinase